MYSIERDPRRGIIFALLSVVVFLLQAERSFAGTFFGTARLVIGDINTRDPSRPIYDISLPPLGAVRSTDQHAGVHLPTAQRSLQPIVESEVLRVVTARGQALTCTVPRPPTRARLASRAHATDSQGGDEEIPRREKDEQHEDDLSGVEELLDVYRNRCFQREEGWWTYSFCYGLHVEQRHDAAPGSNEESVSYMLGVFDPQFDDERKTLRPNEVSTDDAPYTQLYGNGTHCDVSGRPRQIIVKYKCNQEALQIGAPSLVGLNFISAVRELETCVYEIDFVNEQICHHPAYKNKRERSTLRINCEMELAEEPFLGLASDSHHRATVNL